MLNLTYNDMLSAYGQYPAPIRPYLLRAETHPAVRERLSKSFMRVFIELLSRAPIADPGRPIMVRADVVAEDLDINRKTVSRAIGFFLGLGWLRPFEGHDGRNRWGKFCGRQYVIEPPLRELVGLPATALPKKVTSQAVKPPETPPSAKPDEQPEPSEVETKMSHGIRVNKVFEKKEASFKEGAPKTPGLPADLKPLHDELGISVFGICSLMRLAKQVKQRLQDVWIAKQHQIRNAGAKGGRAVAYFRFLLSCGEDFAYVARTRGAIQAAAPSASPPGPEQPGMSDELRTIALACRFKRFQHINNGMKVRFFDGSAEVSRDNQTHVYAAEQMLGLYRGIANGNLVEICE